MTDTHEARVEAAAEAIYDLKPERTAIMGPLGWTDPEFDQWVDRGGYRQKARAALAAADAVVTVDQIERAIMGRTATAGAKAVQRLYHKGPEHERHPL